MVDCGIFEDCEVNKKNNHVYHRYINFPFKLRWIAINGVRKYSGNCRHNCKIATYTDGTSVYCCKTKFCNRSKNIGSSIGVTTLLLIIAVYKIFID